MLVGAALVAIGIKGWQAQVPPSLGRRHKNPGLTVIEGRKTMRFLSGSGRTSLLYGRILKIYDSRHHDILNRLPQLDAHARWYCGALGIDFSAGLINRCCPNFPTRLS